MYKYSLIFISTLLVFSCSENPCSKTIHLIFDSSPNIQIGDSLFSYGNYYGSITEIEKNNVKVCTTNDLKLNPPLSTRVLKLQGDNTEYFLPKELKDITDQETIQVFEISFQAETDSSLNEEVEGLLNELDEVLPQNAE